MIEEYGWNQDMGVALLTKLKQDLKASMKNKDTGVRDAIRQVMSELPKLTVPITLESGKKTTRLKKEDEITDDDMIAIVRGLIKAEETVLEMKKESSSPYIEVLRKYLPRMAEAGEIRSWIMENIDFSSYKSPLQAMGPVMKHFGKTADGSVVKKILSELASAP